MKKCFWKLIFCSYGWYETDCGNNISYDQIPAHKHDVYCPFCGKEIERVVPK